MAGDEVAPSLRGRRWGPRETVGIAVRCLLTLVVVVTAGVVWQDEVRHARSGFPVVWGTFTATEIDRTIRTRDTYGTWASDDGRMRFDHARIGGDAPPVGESVRAAYDPASCLDGEKDCPVEVRVDPYAEPPLALVLCVVGLLLLVVWTRGSGQTWPGARPARQGRHRRP